MTFLMALTVPACGDDGGDPSPTAESETPAVTATPNATNLPIADAFDLATQAPLFVAYGAQAGDFIHGFSSVASGDFNGDGLEDLLIGAPLADGPDDSREDGGEAYVIFGRSDPLPSLDLAANEQDITIFGAAAGDNLGITVLALDLNGDDVDDVVIGAPGVTAGRDLRTDQGRAYVFFGSADMEGTLDLANETAAFDFVVTGAEGFSRIGHAIATGDVNGDNVADLILGAPFAGREVGSPPGSPRKESGEMYVIFGSSAVGGEVSLAFDQPGFTVSSEQRHGQFAAAVAAGDVNGDGIDDIIVGAPQMDFGDKEAVGAAFVFFGGSGLTGRRFIAENEQDASIIGAKAGDSFGLPLASADVNGDGIADIVVGARTAGGSDNDRPAAGAVHMLFGRSDLAAASDLSQQRSDIAIVGANGGHLVPMSLALSDVTADAAADIILTTFTGPSERPDAGAIYIIPVSASLPSTVDLAQPAYRFAVVGAEVDDRLGSALAVLTSGNTPRLLVLASAADGLDNQRPNSGEVYILPIPRD